MTAKILATLGALGLIATIWTADLRYLWTGLLLLAISVGIAAHNDQKSKNPDRIKQLQQQVENLKLSKQMIEDLYDREVNRESFRKTRENNRISTKSPDSITPGNTTLPPGLKMDIWYTMDQLDDGKFDVWQHDRLETGIANTYLGSYTKEQISRDEHRKGQK